MSEQRIPPADMDIAALLTAALSDEPRTDFTRRVMDRIAGVTTLVELGRLLSVAPVHAWLAEGEADRRDDADPRDDGAARRDGEDRGDDDAAD